VTHLRPGDGFNSSMTDYADGLPVGSVLQSAARDGRPSGITVTRTATGWRVSNHPKEVPSGALVEFASAWSVTEVGLCDKHGADGDLGLGK